MPSLRLFGRPWRTSTDVLAVPCLFGCSIAVCYIAVFGGIAGHLRLWSQCGREGKQYIATSAGLFVVFGVSLLNQSLISLISFRGNLLMRRVTSANKSLIFHVFLKYCNDLVDALEQNDGLNTILGGIPLLGGLRLQGPAHG